MRFRTVSLAFLLSVVLSGGAWLSLQPVVAQLIESAARGTAPSIAWLLHVRAMLPALLALDVIASSILSYVVLYFIVERPLRATEKAVAQWSRPELALDLEGGGPLLARLQASLRRSADALRHEQELTQRQLSDILRSNEKLAAAQAELAASERMATVGRLAAGVAHEVGNPLSGILGYLSVASSRTKDPELIDFLTRIEHEVRRIDEIVRSLLDMGRPISGPPAVVDLQAIAENCVRLAKAAPEFAGVSVTTRIQRGTSVRALPGPLSQIVLNLCVNAGQAMEGQGKLTLDASADGPWIRLDVEDNGPGIPPENLDRLFEPFFTTKAHGRGSGLGLAISRHLATVMNGQLTAANGDQGGARFTLRLPAP